MASRFVTCISSLFSLRVLLQGGGLPRHLLNFAAKRFTLTLLSVQNAVSEI